MKVELRALLRANAALLLKAPGGIDWGMQAQGATGDNIVLSQVSAVADYGLSGRLQPTIYRVQVDCYSSSAGGADALAADVQGVLDGYRSDPFLGVFLITSSDTRDGETDSVIYRVSMDFQIVFRG